MHRVLQIPELLREIVAELDDPYGRRRGHILAMALVCKIFHEPAMDALWAKLNSLKPLAYCVPPSAQHNDGTHLVGHHPLWVHTTLTRPLDLRPRSSLQRMGKDLDLHEACEEFIHRQIRQA